MDTPERNQIGTPLSKFEESPFSNFANSLSPINPVKALHVSQTFSSLSFSSPPSVFTSPHVNLQKESRFLRSHQVSDLAREQFSSVEGNACSKSDQQTSPDEQFNRSTDAEDRGEKVSANNGSAEPLSDVSEGAGELPRLLKYDSGSPDCRIAASSGMETICEQDLSTAIVPFLQEPSNRESFRTELNSQMVKHDNEEASCDWQHLISCGTDLFVFDSPDDATTLKGSCGRSLEQETNVYASLLSRFPSDEANELQSSRQAASCSYSEVHESMAQSTQPMEANELNQIDQASETLEISCVNEFFSGNSAEKSGNENFYNLHRGRGMRRRCLTFDMTRPKKNVDGIPFSRSLTSFVNEEIPVSVSEPPVTPLGDSSRCILPGIGLHLNALAAASRDSGILYQEMLSPTSHEPLNNSSASASLEKDGGHENGFDDSAQPSTYGDTDEFNSNSPKRKRRKFESNGEGDQACKRCNCKKSKCLKLYCECFAAGVYCVEPCSCQDCFNKPIHEETVLATRKQIESRNPLAFAPKVIRTSDSTPELGEDSTRTPASARHKRGCNCKKSNCLKKYCECYQGGVGCSINCRCEGCKNAFGRKDGEFRSVLVVTEAETEGVHASERSVMDKSINPPVFGNDDNKNSEFTLPKTPLRHYRPSVPLPTSSKGKPPRSSLGIQVSSSSLHPVDGQGRSTFLRSQSKIEKHYENGTENEIPALLQNCSPPSSGLKTSSPKSKRISPPHHDNGQSPKLRSSRKLILQSIPSFPSLTPGR